jgi:thiol:disulfide interchange protein DsbD
VEASVKRIFFLAAAVAILGGVMISACGGSKTEAPPPTAAQAVTSHRGVEVRWERDWDTAFDRARAEGKPVLVNFSAEWCVWCKHLDTITYKDAKVARVLVDRVVPLNVDMDRVDSELLSRHGVDAPPTVVLLTDQGRELGRIPGYMPPTGFLRAVEGFLDDPATS